jgi:hypothetical protein
MRIPVSARICSWPNQGSKPLQIPPPGVQAAFQRKDEGRKEII